MEKTTDIFERGLDPTSLGVAILVSCIIRSFNEIDTSTTGRFVDVLEDAYQKVQARAPTQVLQMMKCSRELVLSKDDGLS